MDEPFWPEATGKVKAKNPQFIFMAEVYWDPEWDLMQREGDDLLNRGLYLYLPPGDFTYLHGKQFTSGVQVSQKPSIS